jgi:hypothetical protein
LGLPAALSVDIGSMRFFSAFRKPYSHPAKKYIIRRQVKKRRMQPLPVAAANQFSHPLYCVSAAIIGALPDVFAFEGSLKPLNLAAALDAPPW